MSRKQRVLVTGGAGYVGSRLVPKLLQAGFPVTVLDLYLYGIDIFADYHSNTSLREVRGDIRDQSTVELALEGCKSVIHLACISNDPSFELNPKLGKSINFDAFRPLVQASKRFGVERLIYASSSSVYGIKDDPFVTEELSLEPLTDYSKYKALCETVLEEERSDGFATLIFRPATVCGFAPRLRLDLTVNILTNHAINTGKIRVFGGIQKRPNIHIEDITDLYVESLNLPSEQIDGRIFNAGFENHSVMEIAEMVREVVGSSTQIEVEKTDDLRSYHISSDRLTNELGFRPKRDVPAAVDDLAVAFERGEIPHAMNDPKYYNIRTMQNLALQ